MATKAKIKANAKYNRKAYESISIRVPKSLCLNNILTVAAQKAGKSKAQYIYDAIETQLHYDGITIDCLVDLEQPNKDISEDTEID